MAETSWEATCSSSSGRCQWLLSVGKVHVQFLTTICISSYLNDEVIAKLNKMQSIYKKL